MSPPSPSAHPRPAVSSPVAPPTDPVPGRLAASVIVYALLVAIVALSLPEDGAAYDLLTNWMALPAQLGAALVAMLTARRGRGRGAVSPQVWWLLAAAEIAGIVAGAGWNLFEPREEVPYLATGDILFICEYLMFSAALTRLFLDLGGRWREPLVWMDAAAFLLTVLGALSFLALGPMTPLAVSARLQGVYVGAYAVCAGALLAVSALVWLRAPRTLRRGWLVALVAAGCAEAVWICGWVLSWIPMTEFLGGFADYGEVLVAALVAVAAARFQPDDPPAEDGVNVAHRIFGLLPLLALTVAMVVVVGVLETWPAGERWPTVGLVALAAALLVARHQVASRRYDGLMERSVRQEVDARLGELVRLSGDAFLIVDAEARVTFASAAVADVLGRTPATALGRPFIDLLGPASADALQAFFTATRSRHTARATLDWHPAGEGTATRCLALVGTDRTDHPPIRGYTIVARDVTRERALEREVVEAATQERLRLAADVHDGIGQDLTGIALLMHQVHHLQPAADLEQRARIRAIIDHVQATLQAARQLARGLSPIYVAHGSIGAALRALASAYGTPSVTVEVDDDAEHGAFADLVAENIYRIAAEAVVNARRHARATQIEVRLVRCGADYELRITDDGAGFVPERVIEDGVGRRLMEYRARLLGGELTIASDAAGTRIVLVVPAAAAAARPAARA